MIISFSLFYSLVFPPSFLSSLSSFVFLLSLHLFFFLSLNYFYSFFSSLTFFSRSIFRIHYFYHLLSLFFTLFLSITLFSFPSRCYSIFLSPSLFSPRILSVFLSSISVSFPSLYMLCATLHDRESIVGLVGFRFRRVARFLFTATYIAKDDAFYSRGEPLRSFCGHTSSKLNSPLSSRHIDALRLLWYRFPRIFQRMAYLPGIVSWPRRREQVNGHAAVRFISVLFPLFSLSLCFPSTYIFFLSFCTRNNYPMGKFKYSHNLSCFIIIEHGEQLYSIFREKCLTSY